VGTEVDKLKLPKGVLDGKELEEILEEETGLGEAAEGQIEKKASTEDDKDYDSLLKKTETIEKEITSIKSETSFLREKLNEQSDVLLELLRLVKDLEK
jgi:predicted RNase H-like nuclease (RuvC/YqgF family)